jgi:rubredoxin-NAD+ reductase
LQVHLANGTQFTTDIVLSAVGLRPDLRLASAAGLATGRGILVDASGQTSAPHVYAVGDCAEYATVGGGTRTLPYISPLMAAARAIARTLTGTPSSIDMKESPVLVKTPSFPVALVPPPLAAMAGGAWHDSTADGRMVCRFLDADGVMLGFCVAPQDAASRNALLAGLGSTPEPSAAAG